MSNPDQGQHRSPYQSRFREIHSLNRDAQNISLYLTEQGVLGSAAQRADGLGLTIP
jgi:hypothetical protein